MASFFGFGSGNPIIEIKLDGIETRKHAILKDKNNPDAPKLPVYIGDDDLTGIIEIKMNKIKKFEHTGIRVELVGHIEILYDKTQSSDFMSMARELEPAGFLYEDKTFKFNFAKFDKQVESFNGNTAKLRYFLRVTINRNYNQKVSKEQDIIVYLPTPEVEQQPQSLIKLEVGIEDCLHIEFEYNRSKYHLKDCVTGKVSFKLVRIKIKYMELHIIKREITGTGPNQQTENETLVKYEVMDGCPHKEEVIPIRLYLSGVDLTPSHKNISNKFTVKHFLNLVLVDEEDRRYFKQQEITFYRKK